MNDSILTATDELINYYEQMNKEIEEVLRCMMCDGEHEGSWCMAGDL